jgi:hypothetical protein
MKNIDYNLKTTELDSNLTMRMPQWMRRALKDIAMKKGTTVSALVLNIVKSAIIESVRE